MGESRGSGGRSSAGPFRAHPRRQVRIAVLVTHVTAGWQRQAQVENLGLGGARLRLEARVSPGDAVTLSFTAPTLWDPLVLRARVAWVEQAGAAHDGQAVAVGVAFEHRAAEATFALYELIVALAYE